MLFEKIKLEDDEQIFLLVRRHWFILAVQVLGMFATAVMPFIIFWFAATQDMTRTMVTTAFANYSDLLLFVGSLWLLMNWMLLAKLWTDYYLDLWVVTDRRIISIDQRGLFFRNVGSFRLERLQDMNIEIPGFLATMLDYGHVHAETASDTEAEFHAKNLPHPREIKSLILEAADNRLRYTTRRGEMAAGL